MADKKRSSSEWDDVRYFLALARSGSLSATARGLGVNHATVARRVRALEAGLGRSLFDRRADGYALTPQGAALLDDALAMERAARALHGRGEAEDGPRGHLRLTTLRSLAEAVVIDGLGDFARRYPGLTLEVVADSRLLSVARGEADLALRVGPPRDSLLKGRRVGRIAYGFYGAADIGWEADPPLIGFDRDNATIAEAVWLERRFAGRPPRFRANTHAGLAAAARAGFGIALLPRYLGDHDPGLKGVALGEVLPPRDLWLLTRADLASLPAVRAAMEALTALVAKAAPRLEGRAASA